jgi:catalase
VSSNQSRRIGVLIYLAALPLPIAAQQQPAPPSLPQQIADVMVQLNGGLHTGFRFAHAKGIVTTGTFTPAPGAKAISTAAHLNGGPVPVTVRFSDGTGVPQIPDTDSHASPRGVSPVHAPRWCLHRHRRQFA